MSHIAVSADVASFLTGDAEDLLATIERWKRAANRAHPTAGTCESDALDAANDMARLAAAFAGRVQRALDHEPRAATERTPDHTQPPSRKDTP